MTPEALKNMRENLGLTQQQIAKELDLSPRFWRYRENGERKIPRWLACAVNWLWSKYEPKNTKEVADDYRPKPSKDKDLKNLKFED